MNKKAESNHNKNNQFGRSRRKFHIFLVLTIIVFLVFVSIRMLSLRQKPGPARNLVLVVFDTLRADRMSFYGYSKVTTPFLERNASDFLRFADVKAPAPWTIPSHASLFTGLRPSEHHAQWGRMFLDDRFETLAEILRDNNFDTAGFSANPLVSKKIGLAQGFDRFQVIHRPWAAKSAKILVKLPGIIDQARDSGRRFFIFLNFMDTHIPYKSSDYGSLFGVADSGPVKNAKIKWEINSGQRPFTDEEKKQHGEAYNAAVRYLDDVAREILELLSEKNVLEETVVVFTSDHGDGLGQHPEIGHCVSTWEEQLDVPLFVRFPDRQRGGEVFSSQTTLTAFMPSVLDWLEVPRPKALIKSPDLEKASKNKKITADYRNYFSEMTRETNIKMAKLYPEIAARTYHSHITYCDQYKLTVNSAGDASIYDLSLDPLEQNNLADDGGPALQACLQEYEGLLEDGYYTPFQEEISDTEREEAGKRLDVETLRSLGYLQ